MGSGNVLKDAVKSWLVAIDAHTSGRYSDAVDAYTSTDGSSARMLYNTACAYVRLGDTEAAIERLSKAIERDENMAIAYFQRGVIHLQKESTEEAIYDLEMAKHILRGNRFINYRPLGMMCKLHSCDILYNLALAYHLGNDVEEARHVLMEAFHDTEEYDQYRNTITSAISALKEGRNMTSEPFTISADKLFVPPKSVTQNLHVKKLKGVSKVVFSSFEDASPGFHGPRRVEKLKQESPCATHAKSKLLLLNKLKKTLSLNDISLESERWERSPPLGLRRRSFSAGDLNNETTHKQRHVNTFKRSIKKSFKKVKKLSKKALHSQSDSAFHRQSLRKRNFAKSKSAGWLNAPNSNYNTNTDDVNDCEFELEKGRSSIEVDNRKANDIPQGAVPKLPSSKPAIRNCTSASAILSGFSGSGHINRSAGSRLTRMVKSTGDMKTTKVVLPLEKKRKSNSSLTSLRKLLPMTGNKSSKKKHEGGHFPTMMMEGFQSVNSLLAIVADVGDDDLDKNDGVATATEIKDEPLERTLKIEKQKPSPEKAKEASISRVFGDRSTVVNYALSNACDVATATVTPTSDGKPHLHVSQKHVRHTGKIIFAKRSQGSKDSNMTKSKKSKRAPEPPKDLANSLFATCKLFSAFVESDFGTSREDIRTSEIDKQHGSDIENDIKDEDQNKLDENSNLLISCESHNKKSVILQDDISIQSPRITGVFRELSYMKSDGSIVKLVHAKSPPPSYPPPQPPKRYLKSHRRIDYDQTESSIILSDNSRKANICNNVANNSSELAHIVQEIQEDEHGYAIMNDTDELDNVAKSDVEDNINTEEEIRGNKSKIDDNDYMNMARGLIDYENLKRIPPSYPPPPLRIKYKKHAKKQEKKQENLQFLLGKTLNFAAAFAGLKIDENNNDGQQMYCVDRNSSESDACKADVNQNCTAHDITENIKCYTTEITKPYW